MNDGRYENTQFRERIQQLEKEKQNLVADNDRRDREFKCMQVELNRVNSKMNVSLKRYFILWK